MRSCNTNNSAETIFKQVKENMLNRDRLYNPVQLFEFFVVEFVQFFKIKLGEFLTDKRTQTQKPTAQDFEVTNTATGLIVLSTPNEKIQFDLVNGVCQCSKGKDGSSCQHSVWLSSRNYVVPNEMCSHIRETKQKLFFVIYGQQMPDTDVFASIHTDSCPDSQIPCDIAEKENNSEHECLANFDNEDHFEPDIQERQCDNPVREDCDSELENDLKDVHAELMKLSADKEMHKALKTYSRFIQKNLKKATGVAKIIDALKNIEPKGTKKKIRVQKASIARRLSGQTTTSAIGCGRYTKGSFLKARNIVKKARPHSLSISIKNNHQNSGKF